MRKHFLDFSEGATELVSSDEIVKLLTLAGCSLPYAIIDDARAVEEHVEINPISKAPAIQFTLATYGVWHASITLVCPDDSLIGMMFDRNGLRPGPFVATEDRLVVLGL